MRKLSKLGLIPLLFVGCSMPPKPIDQRPILPRQVTLREVYSGEITKTTFRIEHIRNRVVNCSIPIYFFVEDNAMNTKSAVATGKIPESFDLLTRNILAKMGIKVITSEAKAEKYNVDKQKKLSLYEIEGSITSYAKNRIKLNDKPGVDIKFGSGHGEGESEAKWENRYQLSSLTLKVNIKHAGMVFLPLESKVDLEIINKAENYNISVYGSGIGIKRRSFMKDSTEEALEKMLTFTLIQAVEEILNKYGCKAPKRGSWTPEISTKSVNQDAISKKEQDLANNW